MASSPSHKFGQIIGDLLEEIMGPQLQDFCDKRGLYLDKKGERGAARGGKKVSWRDKFGNDHNLDFVIEKGGTKDRRGRPLAFIEAAWRRYTKHSRNKAQEIQGAVLPIAERHEWDKPFLGAILAGVFTEGSLTQMRSSGFEVVLFPYSSIVEAFASIGINAAFDESTPDIDFEKTIRNIKMLIDQQRASLKQRLIRSNQELLDQFFKELQATLDRKVNRVIVIPLHGNQSEFISIKAAVSFIQGYNETISPNGVFRQYEVIVRYSNGDKIEAIFKDKQQTLSFLNYISDTETD